MIEFDRYDLEKGTIAGKTALYNPKMIRAIEETDYGCNILLQGDWIAIAEPYEKMKALRDGKTILDFNPFNYPLSRNDLSDIGQILYEAYRKGGDSSKN